MVRGTCEVVRNRRSRGMKTQQLGVNVLFDCAVSTRLVFQSWLYVW